MTALILMRLSGFIRTGRFIPPLISALVLLGILYGGGQAVIAEAYGVSALLMFPVLAWQTKLLLDTEPDVQRRMALVALRSRSREAVGGMLAAAIVAVPIVLIAMALPWIVDALKPVDVGSGLLLGLWAHLIVIPPALALGGLSSRVVAGTAGRAAAILTGGLILALVLGLRSSPAPWLAPPLISVAHTLAQGATGAPLVGLTAWALVWATVALAGYGWLRRARS
jgi:hypothetical protein